MVIAAAVCPWPPVLAAELTGPDPVISRLREACGQAVRRLVGARPDLVAVIGPARQTRAWDPDSGLDLSVFAPALSRAGDPALPPSLGLGALLLDQAGYSGPRVLQAVAEDEPPAACAELGAVLGGSAARACLLVMGDGSARRGPRAPGHLDPRAAAFDAETERAFRRADFDALLAISPVLARELMATGRPAWQVMAGALRQAEVTTDVLYSDDPFGVAYLVAVLESRPGKRFAATPLRSHASRMRIRTVQRRDWRKYRDIRLAALQDAPSAFASTWPEEAALTESQWMERAQRSQDGDTLAIMIAADDADRWAGLAAGYRPGDRGADAELISMWVAPDCRGHHIGSELVRAVLAWAQSQRAGTVALWVNAANRPAISLYEKAGFRRTGEVDQLPSDPAQQEIRMLRRGLASGEGFMAGLQLFTKDPKRAGRHS